MKLPKISPVIHWDKLHFNIFEDSYLHMKVC